MSNEPVPSHAPGAPFELTPKTVLLTIALMLGMIMQSLDATIANVALPHIQGSMSAAQDQVTWVLTSYVVMAGICTPLTGFLVMRYGRRRLFFLSVTCFTLASMLCGAAQSLEQIVLFRMLQGAAGAFLMPLSQAVVMDIYPKEKHTVVLSAWSMGILVAPILGPTIGSYLTETLSWRWAFYINFPFGLLSAVGAALLLSESKRDPHTKFDLLGFVLLGTAIAALQLMLDRGTTLDWFSSSEIVTEALLAALALYAFMAQMFTAAHPFLSRTAFKDTNYIIGLSIGFVFILVALGTSAILPTMFQSLMGYPVITTGLLLMPRGIGSFCTTAFVVRLMRHVDARVLIMIGMITMAFTLWLMSGFTLDVTDWEIIETGLLQGFGMGLVFVPLTTVTFATLEPRFRTEGSSMFALIRNLAISIGVSVDATLLARNTQVNHAELVAHITPFNHALQALAPTLTMQSIQGAMTIDSEINRQAGMIAYNDLFRLSTYLVLGAALLITLVRLPKIGVSDEPVVVEA